MDGLIELLKYSTDEQWTGKYWIDEKKIYRRVLVTTVAWTLTTSWSNINYYCGGIQTHIDTLIYCENLRERGNYIQLYNENEIWVARASSDIYYPVGSKFIIEYTKTTD